MVLALIITVLLVMSGYALIFRSCHRLMKLCTEVMEAVDRIDHELDELEEELSNFYEEQFLPVVNEVFTYTTEE